MSIDQGAAYCPINAPAGSPLAFLVTASPVDEDGNPVSWSLFTDFAVSIVDQFGNDVNAVPTVTSPANDQLLVGWTGEQTTTIGASGLPMWVLTGTVNGSGPFPLISGPWNVLPADAPAGPSSLSDGSFVVQIGTITVPLKIVLGATAGGVATFNGRTGAVEPEAGDYTAEMVGADAAGTATAAVASEATIRADEDAINATAIAAETSRAETAESGLASHDALTAEITRAEGAESTNASAIAAETTRAEAAEVLKATIVALTAETTRAEGVEATLATSSSVTAEATTRANADTALAAAIVAAQAAAEAASDPAGSASTAQSNAESFATTAANAAQAAAQAASVPLSDLPLSFAHGGTGTTSAQLALNALAAAVTSGQYLRGNGTNVVMAAIQAGDVPTLNQSTTGTAANLSGTPALPNGTTASTQTGGDNTTKLATTAFVTAAVAALSTVYDALGAAATAQSNAETFATSAVGTETTRAVAAEALKAPLANPALTGTPTAPTATTSTNTTQIATTAFVQAALPTSLPPNGSAGGDLSGTFPSPTVAKLNGVAAASYALLASPIFIGTPTAPTPSSTDTTQKLATTAFVASLFASDMTLVSGVATLADTVNVETIARTAAVQASRRHGSSAADNVASGFQTATAIVGASIGVNINTYTGSGTINVSPVNPYGFPSPTGPWFAPSPCVLRISDYSTGGGATLGWATYTGTTLDSNGNIIAFTGVNTLNSAAGVLTATMGIFSAPMAFMDAVSAADSILFGEGSNIVVTSLPNTDWFSDILAKENRQAGLPDPGRGFRPCYNPFFSGNKWTNISAGSQITGTAHGPSAVASSAGTVCVNPGGNTHVIGDVYPFRRSLVLIEQQPNGASVQVAFLTTVQVVANTTTSVTLTLPSVPTSWGIGTSVLVQGAAGGGWAGINGTWTLTASTATTVTFSLASVVAGCTWTTSNASVSTSNNFLTAGVVVGMAVTGAGIPALETVSAVTATSLTLSTGVGVTGGTGTLTFSPTGTYTAGSASISLAPATITTNTGTGLIVVDSGDLGSYAQRTVQVTQTSTGSAGVCVAGHVPIATDGTQGVIGLNFAQAGTKASDWTTYTAWDAVYLTALQPRRIYSAIGVNDLNGGATVSTTTTNIATLLGRQRAACPSAELAHAAQWHVGNTVNNYNVVITNANWASQWVAQLAQVALTAGATFIDLSSWFGDAAIWTVASVTTTAGGTTATVSSGGYPNVTAGMTVLGSVMPGLSKPVTVAGITTNTITFTGNTAAITAGTTTLTFTNDVLGISAQDGVHYGDSLQSTSGRDAQMALADVFWNNLSYYKGGPQVAPAPGWSADPAQWVRLSNTLFYVNTNQPQTVAQIYAKGTLVRWAESGLVKYGVVASCAFGAGTVLVTLIATSDYQLLAAPDPLSTWYAYNPPPGFPSQFTWSPGLTGFSAAPSLVLAWWRVVGCELEYYLNCVTTGTSNATTFNAVLPIAPTSTLGLGISMAFGTGTDNGSAITACIATTAGSSTTLSLFKNTATGAWTSSGAKGCIVQGRVPI